MVDFRPGKTIKPEHTLILPIPKLVFELKEDVLSWLPSRLFSQKNPALVAFTRSREW